MKRVDEVAALQRWFHEAVAHPGGVDAADTDPRLRRRLPRGARRLEDLLEPSAQMTARERLDVYASSYIIRLCDVMRIDFPGVAHALGHHDFDHVVREYVTLHPPASFTLNDLGAGFAEFLARGCTVRAVARRRALLVDLATLERAVEEVFHAPRAEPVDTARLATIPPERWNAATFRLIPAHRLLEFAHPVHAYLQAVYDGKSPPLPRRARTFVLVFRKEWRSWRARLTKERFALLRALSGGATLGAALAEVFGPPRAGRRAPRQLAELGAWFQEWTADGLFTAIRVPR